MPFVTAIALIALASACAHKDAGKSFQKSSTNNAAHIAKHAAVNNKRLESFLFIGYVDYFPETKEFYTKLFYQEGKEYPDEDLLESRLDSVIVFEEDWGRERLPMEDARQLLVLSGLDTLFIYNRDHRLVSTASLKRVEYLWNGMESVFVGVFKSGGGIMQQTTELYGMNTAYTRLKVSPFSADEIEDQTLNRNLIDKMHLDPRLGWDMRHYRVTPERSIYSVVSSRASDDAQSFLTLTANNEVKILNREVNNFNFLNILPLPIQLNGQPLLLVSAGYPFSDVMWDYLAAFDGTSYEAVDYNRVDPALLSGNQPGDDPI